MTTAKRPQSPARCRLPDIPQRHPDEKMTAYIHLHRLGNPATTIVGADRAY